MAVQGWTITDELTLESKRSTEKLNAKQQEEYNFAKNFDGIYNSLEKYRSHMEQNVDEYKDCFDEMKRTGRDY